MESETKNSIHPQDGNQIVIGENHATITINNYNKSNNEAIEMLKKENEMFNKNVADIITQCVKLSNDFLEIEKMKLKRKSK